MPFAKAETVFFEQILTGFEPNNITARNVSLFTPDMKTFERSGLQVQRPMPYNSRTKSGLDQTGNFGDVTQLTVPSAIRESDITSIPFSLTGTDLNDPRRMADKAKSAVISLSAALDGQVAKEVANKGSLVVTRPGQIDAYLDGALCEAKMQEQDINIATERCLIFNARDAAHVSANVANRQTTTKQVMSAYERSALNSIGGFETLRASFNPMITAAAGPAATVTATTKHIPIATNEAGDNVDNRYMRLDISSTAGVKVGDAFTIAGVNALSHIHKEDTGEAKDFRVVSIISGGTMMITPAIIVDNPAGTLPEQEYANVTAAAASGAAITWTNTTNARANTFFTKDSVEIIHARLPGDEYAGMEVMREVTDSGIEILFAKQSSIDNYGTKYRLDMWARGHMLNPEMGGILIGGQV